MEFVQLITFLKAAKSLNFSKTAEELGYSQAAVTIQIKQLEADLNVTLFDRIGKKTTLTDAGQAFLPYASKILETSKQAHLVLAASSSTPSGHLCIGASDSICTYILPTILADYHRQYPEVHFTVKAGSKTQLEHFIAENTIDIACLFDETDLHPEYRLLFSKEEPFTFIASPSHPLSQETNLTLNALSDETFLLTEKGCSYRMVLEHLFYEAHLELKALLEIGSPEAIKRFCSMGLGIALLPRFTTFEDCQKGTLVSLGTPSIHPILHHQLICHKQKWLSPALKTFMDCYIKHFSAS